jgi:hypothetical protein
LNRLFFHREVEFCENVVPSHAIRPDDRLSSAGAGDGNNGIISDAVSPRGPIGYVEGD